MDCFTSFAMTLRVQLSPRSTAEGPTRLTTVTASRAFFLKADKGPHGERWTDRKIWQSLETSPSTVARMRETFALKGPDVVFARKRQAHPAFKRIFDGEAAPLASGRIVPARQCR